jgi:single-stranded DNA-binding protein
MPIVIDQFRVMCKDAEPELRTVNSKSGEQLEVLNFNVVDYYTPDKYKSPWIKVTLWGNLAKRYTGQIKHNQVVSIHGDLKFSGWQKDVAGEQVDMISPEFAKVYDLRFYEGVVKGNVDGEYDSSSSNAADDFAAKASKASTSSKDIPF